MSEPFVPVYKPLIEEDTFAAATKALENGWLGMGSFVGEFEQKFQAYLGNPDRKCVAVATGTSALHLAMILADLGPGDEVITPSFNNIGDFQAISATGAKPVFCDVRRNTMGIDGALVEPLITKKTKAVIALHYNGVPCDYASVAEVARRHGLRVIEDDCHAVGTLVDGKPAGSYGDMACFSFDAVKTITCIDGGMIVVNTDEEVAKLHEARLLGMSQAVSRLYSNNRAWRYDVHNLGFRYHLANLHASIGLSQLARLDEIVAKRRTWAKYYAKHLADLHEHIDISQSTFDDVGPFMFYILVKHGRREELIAWLRSKEIDTGIHWQPGHLFSMFRNCRHGDLTETERIGREVLTLPFHTNMELQLLDRIVGRIHEFFRT